VMPPFTVENFTPCGHSARPIVRFSDPFTVVPNAVPDVDTFTDPFTVCPSASPFNESATTLPFTVCPTNVTPTGTSTVNRTVVSLSRTFDRFFGPGSHPFGSLPGTSGYTAQIVTPP